MKAILAFLGLICAANAYAQQPAPLPSKTIDGMTFKVDSVRRSSQGGTIIMLDVSSPVRLILRSHSVVFNGEREWPKVTGIPDCARVNPEDCPSQEPLGTWLDEGIVSFQFSGQKFPQKGQTIRLSFEVIRADTFNVVRVGFPPIPVP